MSNAQEKPRNEVPNFPGEPAPGRTRRIRNAAGFHSPKPAAIARHHFDQPCPADGVGGFVPSSPVGIALPWKPHVEPLILRGIAVQKGAVVTCGHAAVGGRRRNNFKLLAALVNPGSQSNEVLDGELFHRLLNFLDVAHVPLPAKDSTPYHGSMLRAFEPSPAITGKSGHDISYFLWPSFRVLSFTRRRPLGEKMSETCEKMPGHGLARIRADEKRGLIRIKVRPPLGRNQDCAGNSSVQRGQSCAVRFGEC